MAAFDIRGLDLFTGHTATPTTTALVTRDEPALATRDELVPSRGWSCSEERCAGRPLSPRERQILTLIIDGKTRKEVAYDLEIAHSTVRVIYSRAMKKLGGHWEPTGRKL